MSSPFGTNMRTLIAAAGLSVQHACSSCGVLLEAYGRDPASVDDPDLRASLMREVWSCTECNVPEATRANRAPAAS